MFTGIVQGTAELVAIEELPNFRTHVIRMPSPAWGEGLALGASVAHNGCCLTVTRIEGELVSFDQEAAAPQGVTRWLAQAAA